MDIVNKPLRNTLFANASFSLFSALSILLFPSSIAYQMAIIDTYWLTLVGIGLVAFAALVIYVAVFKTNHPMWVNLIIVQDVLWVLGSVMVLWIQPWGLSFTGLFLIAGVAMMVGVFAVLQKKHLKTSL